MLSSDLALVSNRASQTLPGSAASTTFAQITGSGSSQAIVRRVAATALTTPQTFTISHENRGTGFNQRLRTLIQNKRVYNNTDLADTGGVVPSFTWNLTLDRPVNSGGVVTEAHLLDALGQLMDSLLISGNLTRILSQEA